MEKVHDVRIRIAAQGLAGPGLDWGILYTVVIWAFLAWMIVEGLAA